MSTISVRLPKYYHDRLRILAEKDKISINQWITLAIGEKISALDTEDYISQRSQDGQRQKFLDALAKVSPDAAVGEEDRL